MNENCAANPKVRIRIPLYIMDQYVNPRNLAAFLGILAIAKVIDRKYVSASLLLLLGAAIHPFMSFFAISFCFLLFCMQKLEPSRPVVANLFGLRPARSALSRLSPGSPDSLLPILECGAPENHAPASAG